MNGKLHTGKPISNDLGPHLLNPFVHKLELDNIYDKIKTAIFTVILLPFRVVVICLFLTGAWLLACLGLHGISEEDLRQKPMTGWRRTARAMICVCFRVLFFAGGFHWIRIRGEQASTKEAPVLCLAPHSTYCDALTVILLGAPSVVAKAETARIPMLGKLINYTQPVYVWRDDPNSRQNTIKEIIDRARSDDDWPQVLIFPEGTCTNRSCLITFKPGAFYPGVPVQPVCIRYPNKLDTVTWTWEGPGALKLLWLTLTQVHSNCEIEFLPVYKPNEAEKADPKLFARNVRNVMAKALDIPVSDYTYDDCRLMTKAKLINLPCAASIVEVEKFRKLLGLNKTNLEEEIIVSNNNLGSNSKWNVSIKEMAEQLSISPSESTLDNLFHLYDKVNSGVIDFREYLLSAVFITKINNPSIELVELAFKLYDTSGKGNLSLENFARSTAHTLGWPYEECEAVFYQIDRQENKFITFYQFFTFTKNKAEYVYMHRWENEQTPKPKSH